MYSLTTQVAPYVHCRYPCSRMFILDEIYYCIKCAKPLCRFCLTEEIESFYCRSCFQVLELGGDDFPEQVLEVLFVSYLL